nr:cilia- and flagella-associated protein 77 [Nothobranchius furzeri]
MMSPRLGVVRKSMLKDPLIIKAPLGKTRTRGLDVPGPDFVFGAKTTWNADGGVAEGSCSSGYLQGPQGSSVRIRNWTKQRTENGVLIVMLIKHCKQTRVLSWFFCSTPGQVL